MSGLGTSRLCGYARVPLPPQRIRVLSGDGSNCSISSSTTGDVSGVALPDLGKAPAKGGRRRDCARELPVHNDRRLFSNSFARLPLTSRFRGPACSLESFNLS